MTGSRDVQCVRTGLPQVRGGTRGIEQRSTRGGQSTCSARAIGWRRHQGAGRNRIGSQPRPNRIAGRGTSHRPLTRWAGIGYSCGRMRARCRVSGRHLTLPLALAESQVDVAVDLLETAPQLLDPVHRVLDASGQFAHLGFQSVHAKLGIDRSCRASACQLGGGAAVDLPLQHAEIPLQAIQAILHPPLLRAGRGVG